MATQRNKGASRGRKQQRQSSPLVWAIGGLLIGLLVALLVWINAKAPPPPPAVAPRTSMEKAPDPFVLKPARPLTIEDLEPIDIPKPEPSRYQFYQELKQQRVVVPAEEPNNSDTSAGPLLLPSKPANSPGSGQSYILQVGSFRKPAQADEMKAKLALLGIEARIEKVRVNDGVWHRVRLGPYKNLVAANRIRSQLHANSIKSMLIKAGH